MRPGKGAGEGTLGMPPPRIKRQRDIEALRHHLADQLDIHPVRTWSAPLLIAVNGLLDAHAAAIEMGFDPAQTAPLLRVIN